MERMSRITAGALGLCLLAFVTVIGCDGNNITTEARVVTLSVVAPPDTFLVGDTIHLKATPVDANGAPLQTATVSWTVSDTALARISDDGQAIGLLPGRVIITAECGSARATIEIEFHKATAAALYITPRDTTVALGDTARFRAAVVDRRGNTLGYTEAQWTAVDTQYGVPLDISFDRTGNAVPSSAPQVAIITAANDSLRGTATLRVRERELRSPQILVPWSELQGHILVSTLQPSAGHLDHSARYDFLIDVEKREEVNVGGAYSSEWRLSPDGGYRATEYTRGSVTGNTWNVETFHTRDIPGSATVVAQYGARRCPTWRSDGSLSFVSQADDTVFVGGVAIGKVQGKYNFEEISWSPDNTYFLASLWVPGSAFYSVYRVNVSDWVPVPVVLGSAQGSWIGGQISPDGKRIVVTDDQNGGSTWVANIDGSELHQVAPFGIASFGASATWSPDSRQLLVPSTCKNCDRPAGAYLVTIATGAIVRVIDQPTLFVSWSR